MIWYVQSTAEGDTQRGQVHRGRVSAVCGIQFRPVARHRGEQVDEQLAMRQRCPQCVAEEEVR